MKVKKWHVIIAIRCICIQNLNNFGFDARAVTNGVMQVSVEELKRSYVTFVLHKLLQCCFFHTSQPYQFKV